MTVDKSMQESRRTPGDGLRDSARTGAWATAKKVEKKVRQRTSPKKTTAPARKPTTRSGRTARTTGKPSTSRPESGSPHGAASETTRAPGAAPTVDSGIDASASSNDAPRPPAPVHPGATMELGQEQAGGLGSMLALWGPLIIVGFLVLVFRGADEREGDAAAGASVSGSEFGSRVSQADGDRDPMSGARPLELATGRIASDFGSGDRPDPSRYSRVGTAQASIAPRPDFANRRAGSMIAANAPRGAYPPPPGPYRSPWARTPPAGERWAAPGTPEWSWPAEVREGEPYLRSAEAPVQWVRCERPYYWCPAPRSPSW